jgi:cob(I)alamin adenosyltransferase
LQKKFLQLYTGNGKGKTTAAIGQAIRAAGAGMKVIFFQFLKDGAFPSSEEIMLKKCGIKVVRFREKSPLFDKTLDINGLRVQVANDWTAVTAAIKSGIYDMVVLDEVTHLINLKLISEKKVLEDVRRPPAFAKASAFVLRATADKSAGKAFMVNMVLTGRNASKAVIKAADLVTEMKEVKHPYKKGVKAVKGIDF